MCTSGVAKTSMEERDRASEAPHSTPPKTRQQLKKKTRTWWLNLGKKEKTSFIMLYIFSKYEIVHMYKYKNANHVMPSFPACVINSSLSLPMNAHACLMFLLSALTEGEEVFSDAEVSRAVTSPLRRLSQRSAVPAQLLRRVSGRPLLLPTSHPHLAGGLLLRRRRALREGRHVRPVLQVQRPVRPPERSLAPAAALALRRHAQVHRLAIWPPSSSTPSSPPPPPPPFSKPLIE